MQRDRARSPRGIIGNELYRTDDGGKTWRKVDRRQRRRRQGAVFVQPDPHQSARRPDRDRDQRRRCTSRATAARPGTPTSSAACSATSARCGGTREDEHRIILGSDGGVNVSLDGGKTGDYFPNMGIGEAYAIGVDMDDPYNVYGGFQDHDSWKGPSNSPTGPHHARALGHRRARRRHVQRHRSDRQPLGLQHARAESDGPDGSADGRAHEHRADARQRASRACATTGSRRSRSRRTTRRSLYAGAQVLFRSLNRGDTWEEISPDLTTNDPIEDRPQRAVLHDHVDLRVAAQGRHHLGRHRRRQGAADAEPRRQRGRIVTPALTRGRRAGRSLGQPRVRVAARRRDRVRRRRTDSATMTSRRICTARPTAARRGRAISGNLPRLARSTSSSRTARATRSADRRQ